MTSRYTFCNLFLNVVYLCEVSYLCTAMLMEMRQGFVRFYAVFFLSRSTPRTTTKGNDRLDSLQELGKTISFPRPGTDWTTMFTEIRIE